LSEGRTNHYTTDRGLGILRDVIVTFCQINKFFVNIIFSFNIRKMFLRPDEIVSWARWNGSAGRSLETPVLEQVLPALHAPNHFANLFVIDNVPLVARDFRKRILPFW